MKAVSFLVRVPLYLFECAHAPLPEHLFFENNKLVENWQILSYKNFSNGGGVRYYAPPSQENLKSWSELITAGVIVGADLPLKQYVDDSNDEYNARCPGTRHQVIDLKKGTE